MRAAVVVGVKNALLRHEGPGAAGEQGLLFAAAQGEQRPVREQAVKRAVVQLQAPAGRVELDAAGAAVGPHALRQAVRVQIIQPPLALAEKVRRAVGRENTAVAQVVVDDLIAHERARSVGIETAAVIIVHDQQRAAPRVVVGHGLALGVGEGPRKQRKARLRAAGSGRELGVRCGLFAAREREQQRGAEQQRDGSFPHVSSLPVSDGFFAILPHIARRGNCARGRAVII